MRVTIAPELLARLRRDDRDRELRDVTPSAAIRAMLAEQARRIDERARAQAPRGAAAARAWMAEDTTPLRRPSIRLDLPPELPA